MGHDALRAYEGDHVALVGEWDGDTGDRALSHALLTEWRLERAINLPNWSDTAHDLTIWRRRAEAVPLVQAPWPRCCETGACFVTIHAGPAGHGLSPCCWQWLPGCSVVRRYSCWRIPHAAPTMPRSFSRLDARLPLAACELSAVL